MSEGGTMNRELKIMIYGMGGMGSFFKDFFSARGHYVKGYDIDDRKREVELNTLKDFEVIFLCVPMDRVDEAVKEISDQIKSLNFRDFKPLLVDISSVKSFVIDSLKKSGLDFLSIHPMFGPDSEIGLSNVIIVWESGREEEKILIEEMVRAGAVISRLPAELHDKKMAEIQGIAHFILIAFANFLKDKLDRNDLLYASPIFSTVYKLSSRILNQDWKMYYIIQKNAEELREDFIKSLENLNELLSESENFHRLFDTLSNTFSDFEGSTIVLDASRASKEPSGIDLLRGYIRLVDSLILRLIEKRVSAGKKIALHKKDLNMPIEVSEVEETKLREIASKTSLNPLILKSVFEDIMRLTKEEEYKILGISRKIAVLGPMGSFSDEAALKLTGSRLPVIYCSSVEEIVSMVENNNNVFGLIPIENSVNGTVLSALDALIKYDVEVFGETTMEINHVLAAKRKMKLKDIKRIYSHPQAIAQCSAFINNYLPMAEIRYTSSTSDAVSMLDDESCAIVSDNAANLYNLFILKKGIQDAKERNVTRFYLIRQKGASERRGKITSLFFGVEDRPGALKDVLEVFSSRKINLRKLESRPSGSALGDYIFFSEVEKNLDEDDLVQLNRVTTFCRIAGVFDRVDRLSL
jgi:chorismate mutase/prephenate dehydratase